MPDLDRDQLFHYWHPDRFGVRLAPADFRAAMHEVHPSIEAVFSPVHERWLLWSRNTDVTHDLCPGWSLLFCWQTDDSTDPPNQYLPLDGRVLANLYARDLTRAGGGKKYFDRIVQELTENDEKRKAHTQAETTDRMRDYIDFLQIKNIGEGNKFALNHDGSVVPSAGEMIWRQSLAKTRSKELFK